MMNQLLFLCLAATALAKVDFDTNKLIAYYGYDQADCAGPLENALGFDSGVCYTIDSETSMRADTSASCSSSSSGTYSLFFEDDCTTASVSDNDLNACESADDLSFRVSCMCADGNEARNFFAVVQHPTQCGADDASVRFITRAPFCEDDVAIQLVSGSGLACNERLYTIRDGSCDSSGEETLYVGPNFCIYDDDDNVFYSLGCPCSDYSMPKADYMLSGYGTANCVNTAGFKAQTSYGACVTFDLGGAAFSYDISSSTDACTDGESFSGTMYAGAGCDSSATKIPLSGKFNECLGISPPGTEESASMMVTCPPASSPAWCSRPMSLLLMLAVAVFKWLA